MDATQMLDDSILESDEDHEEENINDRGDPLGKLCILKNEHIPENEFPLFLGDNMLGRDPNSCTLSLLSPSVSKQHASISLSVFRRKGGESEVEALVWDLGSMNGTRKGHFKLTPNVRYALSEGDSLVVADIPCKFKKCTTTTPKNTRTPVNQNLKERLSQSLRENGGNLNAGSAKNISTKTKDMPNSEVTRGTPARTSCLSFEQTPTQPQGTLVPDSESESDEEISKIGDKRRKNIVSDSDSFKSPTCSTFMSPTSKVVPESEDESPITPSSSLKNRTDRVDSLNDETDININRQELMKGDALEIMDDSEEETGYEEAKAAFDDARSKNGHPKPKSLSEGVKSPSAFDIIPQFNMDSDTDVDEEENAPVINNAPVSNTAHFHMDSDTDVSDNDTPLDPPFISKDTSKHSQSTASIPIVQPKGISMDSDTDVSDNDTSAPIDHPSISKDTSKHSQSTASIPIVQPKGNSLDSDTDVEDDYLRSAVNAKSTEPQNATNTAHKAAQDFHLDSDTDVEDETNITDGKDETPSRLMSDTRPSAALQSVDSDTDNEGNEKKVAKPDLEIMSNSDTDVEDEVKPISPGPNAAEAKLDSSKDMTGRDVIESNGCPATEGNAADVDSDTDAEDTETDSKGDKQVPVLDREITPGIQAASLHNCSTPVQEGNIEEMDTQAFLSPSLSSFRRPLPPGQPVAFSPCVSQEEDELVVAETQSFILNDRGQNTPPKNPDLDSSVNERDVSGSSGGNFQLELSDSSYCQAQALAMESTQAYVTVDPGLEETQPYTDEPDLPVDIALQATQAYICESCSDEEEDDAEDQPAPIEAATNSPNANTIEGEAGKQVDAVYVAETQPMCIEGDDDDSEESAPFFRKRKARKIQEEETQKMTNSEISVAETQPMDIPEDRDSDEDSPPVFRKRKAKQLHLEEEQTQPIEIPVEQSEDEESTEISKTKADEETQPCLDSDLTVAQTQPIATAEESDGEDLVPVVSKSPKKLHAQEEEKTLVNLELSVAATQPLGLSEDISSDEEDSIVAPRKRKAKQLHLEEEQTQPIEMPVEQSEEEGSTEISSKTKADEQIQPRLDSDLTVAQTQPISLSEDIASDEEEPIVARRKRKAKQLEDTQSLTNTEDTKPEPETSNVRKTRGGGKLGKEKHEAAEDVGIESSTRRTKGKSKAVPVSRGRRGKAKVQLEDESEEEETQVSNEEDTKEQIRQKEREEMERLEKERVEQEEKEKAAKIQKEREEKEQIEKERLEEAKRAEEELQRQEEERRGQEKARLEREEKERLEKQAKEEAPRRGRRAARTVAPDTLENYDVPARRTRSRSNSSNSLSSERSVSSITSQNSRGRGRGRGGRRSEVPVQKTPARTSNRRRTVAAETTSQITEMSAPSPGSRSNSPNSQNSGISSVSSQGRGRGGRQRGRGRKAEPEPESVAVQVTIEKALQRGRKSRKISPENDDAEVSQQSGSTRGQDGAEEELSKSTPDKEEEATTSAAVVQKVDPSSKENSESSQVENEGRRGRKRQIETKKETKEHSVEEEKDVNQSVKRKAVAKNTQAKKNVKDVIDDNTKPKGRGRPSTVQKKKKSEGEDDNGSAGSNSMEQEATPTEQEVPQTPTVSRKRHSVIPESSSAPKTPRSSSASPSTVGRRAASQTYKVLFTGVVDEAGEKVLSCLGGSMAKDVTDMNCLVTDKVRRTVKFLCAVAKGIPIVTTQWLEKSGKAGTFLTPTAYIVKDREQEQKFNFSLGKSLKIANSQPLLQGYEIHVTKSVKPEPVQMKDIITCSGAVFLPKMPSSKKGQTLVISCEDDWSLCDPAVSSSIPVLTAEFILTGILQQKLDFETHKLTVTTAQTGGGGGRGRGWKK